MLRYVMLAGVLAFAVGACDDKKKADGKSADKKSDDKATEKLITDQQRKNAGKPPEPGELK